MVFRKNLFNFFLWWSVIGISTWIGGTLFHMSVVVPMWSESPPESVKNFFGGTSFNRYIPNFYSMPWMMVKTIPVLISFFLGWYSKPHRRLLFITLLTILFGIIYSVIYIFPINEVMMKNAGFGKSPEEIKSLVDKWVFADRLRFIVMSIGYFCLLQAFRLPVFSPIKNNK